MMKNKKIALVVLAIFVFALCIAIVIYYNLNNYSTKFYESTGVVCEITGDKRIVCMIEKSDYNKWNEGDKVEIAYSDTFDSESNSVGNAVAVGDRIQFIVSGLMHNEDNTGEYWKVGGVTKVE